MARLSSFFNGCTLLFFFLSSSLLPTTLGLQFGFPYGSVQVRGVSLGGWLLIECWMTPTFCGSTNDTRTIDEWTFGQYMDPVVGAQLLKQHWDTFITEQDFRDIAAAGLNHVRIPIGHWAYDVIPGEPYIQGQLPYLAKAIQWARNTGLKVIVDLHGGPGSQNGFDNSGRLTSSPQWHIDPQNILRTRAIVARMGSDYKDMVDVVPAIQPLNEPAGWLGADMLNKIKQFYYDAYGSTRWSYGTAQQSNTVLLLSDAFQSTAYWRDFMPYPGWEGAIMDKHIYQLYSDPELRFTRDQHISAMCARGLDMTSATLWQVVGEWSPATTDCAASNEISPRPIGSRYEGTVGRCTGLSGSGADFSQDYKEFLGRYWQAQVETYEKAQGWIMWSWKFEHADDWSYQAGLRHGWIPQNAANRKYPRICS